MTTVPPLSTNYERSGVQFPFFVRALFALAEVWFFRAASPRRFVYFHYDSFSCSFVCDTTLVLVSLAVGW